MHKMMIAERISNGNDEIESDGFYDVVNMQSDLSILDEGDSTESSDSIED